MKYSVYSRKGRNRKENQDATLLCVRSYQERLMGMAAICDGVSCSSDGAIAAQFVIASLQHLFEKGQLHQRNLCEELNQIHHSLIAYGEKHHKQYGTTCSLIVFLEDEYRFVQIGDSRIYLNQNGFHQLSVDQTLAQAYYDAKLLTLQQFQASKDRHVLTQCMGMTPHLTLREERGRWKEEDGLFLCSDGIYHLVKEAQLHEAMTHFLENSKEDQALWLVELAQFLGEQDDCSAIFYTRSSRASI